MNKVTLHWVWWGIHDSLCRKSISSRSSHFLPVIQNGRWWAPMYHIFDVGDRDPHPEGYCGDKQPQLWLWLCKLLGNVLLGYMVNFSMIKVNQVFILQLRRKKLDKFTIQLKTVSDGPEEKQFKLFTYIVLSIFSLKKLYFKLWLQ